MTAEITGNKKRLTDELSGVLERIRAQDVIVMADSISGCRRVFVTGMGRSGLVAQSFAMRLAHVGLRVHVVGEITAPAMTELDCLVAVSSSGTTATTKSMLDRARGIGSRTALITGAGEPFEADLIITLPLTIKAREPLEYESVLVLGGAFEMSAFLFTELVTLELVRRAKLTNRDLLHRHANLE